MRSLKRNTHSGVSLTELIVGVAIIAMALIPIISSLISGMKTTSASNMEVNAALIGSNILEYIINSLEIDDVTDDLKMDLLSGVSDEDKSTDNNIVKYAGTEYKLKLTVKPLKNSKIPIQFKQAKSRFGRTKYEYARKPLDIKSHIKSNWKYFKNVKYFLSFRRAPEPSLIELFLEIRWTDPKGLERVYNFYSRKARL